jgi:hypothetical protein
MRAAFIDPEQQTVTEIQLSGGGYKEIQKILRCGTFTTGAFLNGSIEAGFDCISVSDDEPEDERFWFQVDADQQWPSSHPIAGFGLATGVGKEGETCDLRISIAELTSRITFTQRKFQGFVTHTGAEAHARGADIVIEERAPIIDGTNE